MVGSIGSVCHDDFGGRWEADGLVLLEGEGDVGGVVGEAGG